MGENIFEPLAEGIVGGCKIVAKYINKLLGLNTLDFNELFKKIALKNKDDEYPKLVGFKKNENADIYTFKVPIGMCISDFEDKLENIVFFMGEDEENIRLEKIGYKIIVKILTNKPKAIYDPEQYKITGFKIPIGIELDNLKVRYWDLSDPANSHAYAAGGTRCGKSTLIRLILSMLVQKSVADIQFSLINIKKVDLNEFENCKNTIHYTDEEEDANEILLQNVDEMKRRYTLFNKQQGVKNIWNYRNKIDKMPIRLVVVEEIAGFEQDKEFHKTLRMIAQQGAGAGIFLLLATQLPNKDVLPNLTKQNINTVFGGKCKDSIRSDIIIEDGGLNKLKGKGHMKVFDCDDYGTEIQVLWIDDDMVYDIANRNLKRKFKQNKRAIEAVTSITQGDNKNIGL
ncbi:MAG: FtsK/SpoIIIE domain-containing protein [Romboutsia sp.]